MKTHSFHTKTVATLILASSLPFFPSACGKPSHPDHANHEASDYDHGHGHDAESDLEPVVVTQFSAETELFVEFAPLVMGQASRFISHFTMLRDFKPVTAGSLELRLVMDDGHAQSVTLGKPAREGIFLPELSPKHTGTGQVEFHLSGPQVEDVQIVRVTVYQTEHDIPIMEEKEGNAIRFLKEQQWKIDFATALVQRRQLHNSVAALARVEAVSDRYATVTSPATGILQRDEGSPLPEKGSRVVAGRTLARIKSGPRWQEGVQHLQQEYLLAREEWLRVQRLHKQGAAPEKRVFEARIRHENLRNSLTLLTGNEDSDASFSIQSLEIQAPIDGFLTEVLATLGTNVEAGQPVYRILNTNRVLIRAKVPAARGGVLDEIQDARLRLQGDDRNWRVSELDGRLVQVGGVVNSDSRTIDVLFEISNLDGRFRPGATVHVEILTGDPDEKIAVPSESLLEEDGLYIAYIMHDGESFERRILRPGRSSGGYTEILQGIDPGERVVSNGAHLVRLSSLSTSEMGHGHAH